MGNILRFIFETCFICVFREEREEKNDGPTAPNTHSYWWRGSEKTFSTYVHLEVRTILYEMVLLPPSSRRTLNSQLIERIQMRRFPAYRLLLTYIAVTLNVQTVPVN